MRQSLQEAWTRLYHNLVVKERRSFYEVPEEFQEGVQALLDKDQEKEKIGVDSVPIRKKGDVEIVNSKDRHTF